MTIYVLSIDQGTSSSRAIVFDQYANKLATAQQEFTQHFPQNGWVEHDPEEIWQTVLTTCRQAIENAGLEARDIAGIGITNQRETTIVWDRHTGKAIYPAIVWQDRRTSSECETLRSEVNQKRVQQKTGLLIDPYFSATKIKWILDNVPGARNMAAENQLAFGTIDCFLMWRLSNGNIHKTDATNASRTLLFNIAQQCWDEELLELFAVPASLLPSVEDSAHHFGLCTAEHLGAAIPILGVAGDQQSALIGQACFSAGMAKSTYGTGCFLMQNTGEILFILPNQLLSTVAYRLQGKTTFAIEGSIFMAGATVQWLRDKLGIIKSAADTEALIANTPYDHGVYLVPAFTGLGAPYWNPNARAALSGLTRDSGITEIVSAAIQSVGFQTFDLLQAMAEDGINPNELRVDGGMAANKWMLQFLADISQLPVTQPKIIESTALGVAYLALLQLGIFNNLAEISECWQQQHRFLPNIDDELRIKLLDGWCKAVNNVNH